MQNYLKGIKYSCSSGGFQQESQDLLKVPGWVIQAEWSGHCFRSRPSSSGVLSIALAVNFNGGSYQDLKASGNVGMEPVTAGRI